MKLPEGVPDTLDVSHVHEAAPSAFPNGTHVAEVEIDPDTGIVEVVKYTMVGDFGTVINPLLVEGQSHGGVVQGIGQAMFEHVVYSEEGQPLTGSFTDYALPRAADAPSFEMDYHSVPAKTNVLGAKGCGEAGCAGSLPSVMNAIVDALGGKHINMPATPGAGVGSAATPEPSPEGRRHRRLRPGRRAAEPTCWAKRASRSTSTTARRESIRCRAPCISTAR